MDILHIQAYLDLPVWVPNVSERVSIYHSLGFKDGTLWEGAGMLFRNMNLRQPHKLFHGHFMTKAGVSTLPASISCLVRNPKRCISVHTWCHRGAMKRGISMWCFCRHIIMFSMLVYQAYFTARLINFNFGHKRHDNVTTGRNPGNHLGCIKPCKTRYKLPTSIWLQNELYNWRHQPKVCQQLPAIPTMVGFCKLECFSNMLASDT